MCKIDGCWINCNETFIFDCINNKNIVVNASYLIYLDNNLNNLNNLIVFQYLYKFIITIQKVRWIIMIYYQQWLVVDFII